MSALTTHEIAEDLRCSPRKIRKVAAAIGVGVDLGGRAGFRYTEVEKDLIWEAMRPAKPVERRRKRRAS